MKINAIKETKVIITIGSVLDVIPIAQSVQELPKDKSLQVNINFAYHYKHLRNANIGNPINTLRMTTCFDYVIIQYTCVVSIYCTCTVNLSCVHFNLTGSRILDKFERVSQEVPYYRKLIKHR